MDMANVYELSNKVSEVHLKRFSCVYGSNVLECGESRLERLKMAQKLIDYLCDKFNIESVNVHITDTKRPLNRGGEIHGSYIRNGNNKPTIKIYNKTAKRGDVISIKSFFDTLLHEFIHHYDRSYLKFNDSPHTSGFYKRISDLKQKLTK